MPGGLERGFTFPHLIRNTPRSGLFRLAGSDVHDPLNLGNPRELTLLELAHQVLKVTGSGKAKSGGCSNRDMLITRMNPKVHAAIKRSANCTSTSTSTSVSCN